MGSAYLKFFIFILFIQFFVFLGCSSSGDDQEAPIDIEGVHISQVYNRTPKDTADQIDLELYGEVAKENLNQDILYEWGVEYKKIDIVTQDSRDTMPQIDASSDVPESVGDASMEKNPYTDYFFMNTSTKEPLHVILSVYHPGYYVVSLQASSIEESKIYSVLIKVGEPDIPHLFLKVNTPNFKSLKKNDFKGKFFIKYNNSDEPIHGGKFSEIFANKMGFGWYDTGIQIDPFSSFNIKAGTHILDDDEKTLSSISNSDVPVDSDVLEYQLDKNNSDVLSVNSIVFNSLPENNILSIFKDGKSKWLKGTIYADLLTWKTDSDNKDKFVFSENFLSPTNTNFSMFLDNAYLVKLFVGSFGHRVPYNKYYVYFGPEGTDAEELDPKGERDFPGLPYGCLLGKIGDDGNTFVIARAFSYKHLFKYDLYEKSKLDNFVVVHKKYVAKKNNKDEVPDSTLD